MFVIFITPFRQCSNGSIYRARARAYTHTHTHNPKSAEVSTKMFAIYSVTYIYLHPITLKARKNSRI